MAIRRTQKMNFPNSFLKIVESLYTNATSKILINGHLTKPIKMEKGIRQGDPLSLFLFVLAANPLVTQIQNDSTIQGIRIPERHTVKNVSYADDITITITGKQAVYATFKTLTEFAKASGLKLNSSKTQGLYFQPNTVLQSLPQISWNKEALNILGLVIGTAKSVEKNWKTKLKEFRNEAVKLSSHVMTWNAKALLSKTKLLPLITYTRSTYIIPTKIKDNLRKKTEQFISGNSKLTIPI